MTLPGNTVLRCPGRNTLTHLDYLGLYPQLADHHILCIDTAQSDLPYASGSDRLTFCSSERFMLEMHKFLRMPIAAGLIRDMWTGPFENGAGWDFRSRQLASFNSRRRGRILRTWEDTAIYYCIAAMSGFNYHYNKWMFVGEHEPVTPNFDAIADWSRHHAGKHIRFQSRTIYNFKTTALDDDSVIYFNFPYCYGSYGCRYLWTKSKFDGMVHELTQLAMMGHKVCVTTPWKHRSRYLRHFTRDLFPPSLFTRVELKASSVTEEAYYAANF